MPLPIRAALTCVAAAVLAGAPAGHAASARIQERAPMSIRAAGPFDVKMTPQKPDSDIAQAAGFGRMTIDKQFHGDLEATSKGEMIAAPTAVKESAGYVAMERVTGTLHGRSGSFVLQHDGTMKRGVPRLSVTVVPDSGTGELKGLEGTMEIVVASGKHTYDFRYTLKPE